jgi:ABC-type branched-subunit amino acid transport system substrate-binding protein
MKTTKIVVMLLAAVLLLLPITSCPQPEPSVTPPESPETPETPGEPEAKVLKVGAHVPFQYPYTLEAKKCFEIIVDEFNKAGGLVVQGEKYNVEMIIYDDQSTAEGARTATERLIHEDKVMAILSHSLGGLEATESAKMLNLTSNPSEAVVDPEYNYVYRTAVVGSCIPILWAQLKKDEPEIKTAVLAGMDNEEGYFRTSVDALCAESLGIEVLDTIFYAAEETDFSAMATKIKQLNPDLVALSTGDPAAQGALQWKAIYQSGWEGVKWTPIAPLVIVQAEICGIEALEGIYTTFYDIGDLPTGTQENRDLKRAYIEKYGEWNEWGLDWVHGWYFLIGAIQKADSLDTDKIAEALHGIEVATPMGMGRLVPRRDVGNDKTVDCIIVQYVGQIGNGENVCISEASLDDGVEALENLYGVSFR